MRAYHGTAERFESFDMAKGGSNTESLDSATGALGIWLTDEADYAADYARYAAVDGDGVVMECEVADGLSFSDWLESDLQATTAEMGCEALVAELRSLGFDGIRNYAGDHTEYCIFDASKVQIVK